jgi:hypothetical protein
MDVCRAIAKALKARLSELTSRVAEIDNELRKPLSADSEDQATDSKIKMRSEASSILDFRKSNRLKRR